MKYPERSCDLQRYQHPTLGAKYENMDFFAAGGFQKLLSELNDDLEPLAATRDAFEYVECGAYKVKEHIESTYLGADHSDLKKEDHFYTDNSCNFATEEVCYSGEHSAHSTPSGKHLYLQLKVADPCSSLHQNADVNFYDALTSAQEKTESLTSFGDLNEPLMTGVELHVQQSLDLLLNAGETAVADLYAELELGMELGMELDMELTTTDMGSQIKHEMAEWEEKFLDNYVEIPELVEILPEKTPLCTEVCELFLHESTTNLQLRASATSNKARSKTGQQQRRNRIGGEARSSTDDADERSATSGYPCTYGSCRNIYAKPAHLKAHLRRHMGEKPYVCTWPDCTWKFSRSDELARHRRSHSGVKPYKCVYCTKCFARSDHLTKHRKVHERRMLAASKTLDGVMPASVFTVRPGRKKKNQIC